MAATSIAHRGDPLTHIENTLEALTAAVASGADMVEIDLKVTRDGHIVVLHDDSLRRLWGDKRLINEVDWPDVASIRSGGCSIPDFETVLASIAVPIMVDFTSGKLVEAALAVATATDSLDRCLFVTGDSRALMRLRELSGRARIGLTWDRRRVPPPELLASLGAEYFNPYWRRLTPEVVESMHAAGYRVSTWTVDRRADMEKLLQWGVDAIVSNKIVELVHLVNPELGEPDGAGPH